MSATLSASSNLDRYRRDRRVERNWLFANIHRNKAKLRSAADRFPRFRVSTRRSEVL